MVEVLGCGYFIFFSKRQRAVIVNSTIFTGTDFSQSPCSATEAKICSDESSGSLKGVKVSKKEVKKFICDVCQASFIWESRLRHHMAKHTGEKLFTCNFDGCDKSYRFNGSLSRHYRENHPDPNRKKTEKEVIKLFLCQYPDCGMAFKLRAALKTHYRIHTGEKPFVCSYTHCNRAFSQKFSRDRHLKTHRKTQKPNDTNTSSNAELLQVGTHSSSPQRPCAGKRAEAEQNLPASTEDKALPSSVVDNGEPSGSTTLSGNDIHFTMTNLLEEQHFSCDLYGLEWLSSNNGLEDQPFSSHVNNFDLII